MTTRFLLTLTIAVGIAAFAFAGGAVRRTHLRAGAVDDRASHPLAGLAARGRLPGASMTWETRLTSAAYTTGGSSASMNDGSGFAGGPG